MTTLQWQTSHGVARPPKGLLGPGQGDELTRMLRQARSIVTHKTAVCVRIRDYG